MPIQASLAPDPLPWTTPSILPVSETQRDPLRGSPGWIPVRGISAIGQGHPLPGNADRRTRDGNAAGRHFHERYSALSPQQDPRVTGAFEVVVHEIADLVEGGA